jgi:hypothetical protein
MPSSACRSHDCHYYHLPADGSDAALQGNVQQSYETSPLQLRTFNASLIGQLTVPIYQGGAEMPSLIHASPHKRFQIASSRHGGAAA